MRQFQRTVSGPAEDAGKGSGAGEGGGAAADAADAAGAADNAGGLVGRYVEDSLCVMERAPCWCRCC